MSRLLYYLVEVGDIDRFVKTVNDFLANGWELQGGACAHTTVDDHRNEIKTWYTQSFIKRT